MNVESEADHSLKVIYRSENFLVVDKNFDLVMNDDDPDRFSLAKLIKRELPELYDDQYSVNWNVADYNYWNNNLHAD